MIFSELYSAYYNTVARILSSSLSGEYTEKELQKKVTENAFSESVLTIIPSLKSGKWQLTDSSLKPIIKKEPTMPLTTLERRWLKAVSLDPRVKLFGVEFPDLSGIEPLFTPDDYKVYDKYSDGDPFESEDYIRIFRTLYSAVKEKSPVKITYENRNGKMSWARLYPVGFEYSMKEDKLRVIAKGCLFSKLNIRRIHTCVPYTGSAPFNGNPKAEEKKDLVLLISNERNTLERAMLHFAHFEKKAERTSYGRYILRLKYYATDESELVIRVLSFGPTVKVIGPDDFVSLIKNRLDMQKSCDLK